jgi:hypothetical protein
VRTAYHEAEDRQMLTNVSPVTPSSHRVSSVETGGTPTPR